jgi:hypothetical protein
MGTSTIEVDFRGMEGGETNASLFPAHYLQNSSNQSIENQGNIRTKPKQPTSSAKKREDLRIHTAIDENFQILASTSEDEGYFSLAKQSAD